VANVGRAVIEEQQLPDDVVALRAIITEQRERIVHLEHNVEVYKRIAFGKSSEKRPALEVPVDSQPSQSHLFYAELLDEAERTAAAKDCEGAIEPIKPPKKPKTKGGRRAKFPAHLPTIRTTYELSANQRTCACGGELHEIGEDVRRELERIELNIVHEIATKKYGCRACTEGVVTAPGPDRPIDKGILGKGFLAHVLTDRFGNHMPYHRLEKKYGSEGLDLSRSVLQRSMTKLGELFEPVYDQLRKEVVDSEVIFTDDTPVTIARSAAGGSKQGRVWIYVDREGRHFYDFTDSRKRDGPETILNGFEGHIHADAYPGYDQLYLPGGATEVACWAHARRKFVDAEPSDPTIAKEAVSRIRALYLVEKEAKDVSDAERTTIRVERSKPLLAELRAWLELKEAMVLPKSPIAGAIRYALNQWDALSRYASDGRLSIDNNAAERALRPFAVGRKNWLFFQRDTGGKTAAVLASLLQSARAVGIDPRTYVRDLMLRIGEETDVKKLTPHGWKKHFAEEVAARRDEILSRILG